MRRSNQVGGNHYDYPIQPIDFIVKNDVKWREANAIKYIMRHNRKNGKEDILKAIDYLEMILEEYAEMEDRSLYDLTPGSFDASD